MSWSYLESVAADHVVLVVQDDRTGNYYDDFQLDYAPIGTPVSNGEVVTRGTYTVPTNYPGSSLLPNTDYWLQVRHSWGNLGGASELDVTQILFNTGTLTWSDPGHGTSGDGSGDKGKGGTVRPPVVSETGERTVSAYYYDERDGRMYSVVLPPKPAPPQPTSLPVPDTTILTLTGPNNTGIAGSGWTIAGSGFNLAEWQMNTGVSPIPCLHIDSDGTTTSDAVWYDLGAGNELDLSNAVDVKITLASTPDESRRGEFLALCLGELAYDEIQLPLMVNTPNTTLTLKVSLQHIPAVKRNAIRYVGLKAILATEFVIWVKDIKVSKGLEGISRYKIRDTRVQGWQMPVNTENILPSPESPGPDDEDLKIDTGTGGSQVTLTRGSMPAGLAWWEIYRNDEDVTSRYHWVANWPSHDRWQPEMAECASASPAARAWIVGDIVRPSTLDKGRFGYYQYFYKIKSLGKVGTNQTGDRDHEPPWPTTVGGTVVDGDITWELKSLDDKENVFIYATTETDIADNPILEEARVHVPSPASALGVYDNRLLLYVAQPDERTKKKYVGSLWLSGRDNHADWHDWGPESWPELEIFKLIGDASACRLPVSEAGQVMRMLPLGAWTGAAFTGPLAILTQGGWLVALQGTVPSLDPNKDGLTLGHRIQGVGASGPYAACKDNAGNLMTVNPNGDVVFVDRNLNAKVVSGPIQKALRESE